MKLQDQRTYEEKLQAYMTANGIQAEHLSFETSCHSVAEAVQAANATPEQFVKNICFIGPDEQLIVAIVKGTDNASSKRIAKALR